MSGKDVVITEAMLDAGIEARMRTHAVSDIYTAMRRAELDATPAARATTVRVRIAVAVDHAGWWAASGHATDQLRTDDELKRGLFLDPLHQGEAYHWIKADVPIPQREAATVIEGLCCE